ncbi:hypothetical protein THAOC_33266, partial [Thalassiosira oceanica]
PDGAAGAARAAPAAAATAADPGDDTGEGTAGASSCGRERAFAPRRSYFLLSPGPLPLSLPRANADPAADAPAAGAAVRTAPVRELPAAVRRRPGWPLPGDAPRAAGADPPEPAAERDPRHAPLERRLPPPQPGGLRAADAPGPAPAAGAGVRRDAAVRRGAARDGAVAAARADVPVYAAEPGLERPAAEVAPAAAATAAAAATTTTASAAATTAEPAGEQHGQSVSRVWMNQRFRATENYGSVALPMLQI